METTLEQVFDENFLWRKYAYDSSLLAILTKYKSQKLDAFAIEKGGGGSHVLIFKGERKRFAFQDGRRVALATAVRAIDELHRHEIKDGKKVEKDLLKEIMLRDL